MWRVCFVAFCAKLSSHSNTESKPDQQMSAKSHRSNTPASSIHLKSGLELLLYWSCSRKSVIGLLLYHTHRQTHTHTHTHATEKMIRAFEAFVLTHRSNMLSLSNHGKSFLIPVFLLDNRLVHLIMKTSHRWIYLSDILSNHKEAQTSAAQVIEAEQIINS